MFHETENKLINDVIIILDRKLSSQIEINLVLRTPVYYLEHYCFEQTLSS